MKHLPAHPTMVHPKTGKPLRALFIDRHGRPRYPILGASPDDPDDKKSDDDKGDDKAGDAADDKGDDKKDDRGFPADTPVEQMSVEQQAAYWKHQSRTHEGRSKAYRTASGGKTPDELKGIVSEAEEARRNKLTVDEKALEDARNEGRSALLSELGPNAVRSSFDLLLGDMPQKDKDEHLDVLDLSKFLTDDHQVDTAKVRAAVKRMQPDTGKGNQQRDYGQGPRGNTPAAGSVAAVRAERRAAREKK